MIKNRKGIEMSFGWIFALIVGGAVIFLAIYASSKFVTTERNVQDSELGKQMANLLSPIETGIEEGKVNAPIRLNNEIRVYNGCTRPENRTSREFGLTQISSASKSAVGKEYQRPGANTSVGNKYLFSSKMLEGKEFYSYSAPLNMPFKIGDIIIMWSDQESYCLVNAYSEVKQKMEGWKNVNFTDSAKDCIKGSVKVCFLSTGCDVDVNYQDGGGYVEKDGKKVYFYGDLLYAAIFSDPEIYECNIARYNTRGKYIAGIYLDKSEIISTKANGCSSNIQSPLLEYEKLDVSDSSDLPNWITLSENIEEINDANAKCKIY